MIARLRRRFIAIATASASLVILLLSVVLNVANFVSVDAELSATFDMLRQAHAEFPRATGEDEGTAGGRALTSSDGDGETNPTVAASSTAKDAGSVNALGRQGGGRGAFSSPDAAYATRYFVVFFTSSGEMIDAELDHIAAVTQDTAPAYVDVALRHGEGDGYYGSMYKYRVERRDDGSYVVVFLDCSQQLYAVHMLLALTLCTDLACIAAVYALVVLLSRRAIDPLVQNVERQKRFITDASHELKTPLTVMTTSLRVLEMEVGHNRWIDKVQGQASVMARLVSALITLSRMDEEEPPLTLVDFDVSAAVSEAAEEFREALEQRGHELVLDVEPALAYHGDESSVRQLIGVLMDNAVKYAAGEGPVTVSLRRGRRGVTLRSTNPCDPLGPAELGRIFDRFYRADESRASGTGSFGIGLSLARAIAEAHHGSLAARCPKPRLIEFVCELR